jgi:YfiH family protein
MMPLLTPDWPAPLQVKAYTTLRGNWGDGYPKASQDREKLKTILPLPEDPIWIKQTHSAIVLKALPENKDKEADATFTKEPNRVCVVATADCLPILICNQSGTYVAAIHAGWRGLANGIIANTLKTLAQPPNELLIWLGPAIGPKKFEVGNDVYEAFTHFDAESARAFIPYKKGKWLADLYALAKIQLASHGASKIYGGNFCTFTQSELFFSYRRDKSPTGRMASLIWIAGEKL